MCTLVSFGKSLEVLRAFDFLNEKRSDFDIVEFLAWVFSS